MLTPAIEEILDDFYQFIEERPETRDLLPASPEAAARVRNAQREHWFELLFGGEVDEAHYERVTQIGRTHERIGLGLSSYLGGYCLILNRFVELVTAKYQHDAQSSADKIRALQKAVFLDIDFIVESYIDAKNSAIRKILRNAEQFIAEIEQIDGELAGMGRGLDPQIETLSQGLGACRGQLEALRGSLPPGEAGQTCLAQIERLQAEFAACEAGAMAVGEKSKNLSSQLERLGSEVIARKKRHRLGFAAQPQTLLSRLKQATQAIFPAKPG